MQRKLFRAFGMVGFAALLALNLASCAGSKAAALPVASDLVPTENGWSFANYPSSAFPDVQFDSVDMLAMFGNDTNVCIDGIADPCTLTAEAATWAQMVNQSRASGSCMGLAVLAAQRFNDNASPVTAKLRSDESTLRAVARAFATQFLSEAQAESEKWLQSSLGDIVETVKASLAENKVDYTLGLFGPLGGHAVTPFAVEYPSEGVARLMVYDSNWPGRNRYVDVNTAADTWTFSYSSDTPETDPEPWVGGRGDMDLTPIRFEKLTCPFCATDVEVKNTSFMIRTDDPEFSLETEAGVITQDGTALPEGASVLKVKGAVGTRTYDYIVKLPQREQSAANTRNELRVKGNASVFAMIPSGIAQFQTSAKMMSPVVFTDNSVSTTDPTISLKVASRNLVASVSGSSTSLTLEGNALSVAVTLPGGEIVQQRVDESRPALLSEVNPSTGEVVVLQASESGQVTRTEIATDGTRTESVSTEKLNLVSVVPVLPPTLESVANPALPAPAERDLNNPNYKADTPYVAPVATNQAPQSDPTPTTEALRSAATAGTASTSTVPLAATADTTPNTIKAVTTTVSTATTAPTTITLPRTTISTTTTLPRTTTTLRRATITTTTIIPRTTTTTVPPTTTTTTTTTTTVPPTTTTTTTTVPPTTTTTTTIPSPTYTVTYNGNGNTGGSVPSSRTTNSSFTVAANSGSLVRLGYTFASWNTAANGSGTTYTANSSTITLTANTTLYAQWTAATLTVTTDEQSGSTIDSVSTTTGGTIASSPGTPTRSGYTFNGWFTTSTGGSAITFPYTHGQTTNFTLYAQWSESTPADGYITAIATGYGHGCALMDTGGVKCWGDNFFGQLGVGADSHHELPTTVSGLSDVTAIAAGMYHTCALLSTGTVKCWGANSARQLGDGTTTTRKTPTAVSGLSGVSAISLGSQFSCALLSTGGVKCWGANYSGQIGDGTTTNRTTPTEVTGLSGVTALASSRDHTCALLSTGGVKCWGANYSGQIGDGTTTNRTTPTEVTGLSGGVSSFSLGLITGCAVMASSSAVKCWGSSGYTQRGSNSGTTSTPTEITGLSSGVAAVSVGYMHACVVLSSGGVKCWGQNSSGQVGDGTTVARTNPTSVPELSSGVTAIDTGEGEFSCALLAIGEVRCWGANNVGQLGDSVSPLRSQPTNVVGLSSGVAAISADRFVSCSVLSAGGVKCWGNNGYNGLGVNGKRYTPVTPDGLGNGTYVATAQGWYHTCALLSTGGVKCWGSNSYGQLGDGTTTYRSTPADVVELSGVTAIAAGNQHTCALLSTGGVKCWGENSSRQIGDGTTTTRSTPTEVSGLSDVTAISADTSGTCALLSTGGVKCWGNGGSTLRDISGLSSSVTAISAGRTESCALHSTGAVACWSSSGSLASGISGLSIGVTAISVGDQHKCALFSTGAVKCYGDNFYAQLGDGTTTDRSTPTEVIGLSNVIAIAAGWKHTCALLSTDAVKCWGDNGEGNVGDGVDSLGSGDFATVRLSPTLTVILNVPLRAS